MHSDIFDQSFFQDFFRCFVAYASFFKLLQKSRFTIYDILSLPLTRCLDVKVHKYVDYISSCFFSGPKNTLDILEKDYVYDVYCADDNYGALSEV